MQQGSGLTEARIPLQQTEQQQHWHETISE